MAHHLRTLQGSGTQQMSTVRSVGEMGARYTHKDSPCAINSCRPCSQVCSLSSSPLNSPLAEASSASPATFSAEGVFACACFARKGQENQGENGAAFEEDSQTRTFRSRSAFNLLWYSPGLCFTPEEMRISSAVSKPAGTKQVSSLSCR
jgi:hypothetical protein